MDNYQAMNFYYGLLNLRAGFFRPNLCEIVMLVAQSVPDEEVYTAYHADPDEELAETAPDEKLAFGSFYEDGHILHNVKIKTASDFFLDPTRDDMVKWQVSFTVAKDVRPADQFIVQFSKHLAVAPSGHPEKPVADFVDQDGVVIAMGEYVPAKHQIVYTFTNYVTDHREIYGRMAGELTVDPQTTPENEFGLPCFIAIDDYRQDFTIDVDYPDLGEEMFLGISSRMMAFDADKHVFTDLIYVNPGQQELNNAYVVFNTTEMVEELSNAIVKPSTMRVEIYQNSRGLKLPQSYGVNLQRLRDITNRFPVVEGDHLVETPLTMSFADNKMRLNLPADKTKDSFVIRVIGEYNDELAGAVRLRARLFGVDQQNVYMSNSTAAFARGNEMTTTGHAVPKEAGVPVHHANTTASVETDLADPATSEEEGMEAAMSEVPTPVTSSAQMPNLTASSAGEEASEALSSTSAAQAATTGEEGVASSLVDTTMTSEAVTSEGPRLDKELIATFDFDLADADESFVATDEPVANPEPSLNDREDEELAPTTETVSSESTADSESISNELVADEEPLSGRDSTLLARDVEPEMSLDRTDKFDEETVATDSASEAMSSSSAYIVSFAEDEDTAEEDLAEPASDESAVGGDVMALSFDLSASPASSIADAAVEDVAVAADQGTFTAAEQPRADEELLVNESEIAVTSEEEPAVVLNPTSEPEEESVAGSSATSESSEEPALITDNSPVDDHTTAPLPLPSRRPPRRNNRFPAYNRFNSSMRHLRRR